MANKLILIAYCTENSTELVGEAERRGLSVEVLVKDDLLFDTIKRYDAKYVVGVCCPRKIQELVPILTQKGIKSRAISAGNGEDCFKQTGVKRTADIANYREALDWLESKE